ncbi:pyrroline-5-carboxylate reductase [Synechococcus lacustris]|uniref:pyrroline-5-carboxylate reductase n=1 Tax=Synechococcus lacustris TaxID=2116544 RepID=UPI0033417B28
MPLTVETAGYQLGLIGLGQMAQALLQPLLEQKLFTVQQVVGCVATTASAQKLEQRYGIQVGINPDPCLAAPLQLLAIKPQQLAAFLQHPAHGQNTLAFRPLLISVLAGVGLERLQKAFPGHGVVRVVPNTPALVQQGLVGIAFGADVSPSQRAQVIALFELVGEVMELPEQQLDAFLALTASGPAFAALVVEGLADGAVAAGLPRQLATDLAIKMLRGSALLLEQKGLHPAQLKDMVSSPGGTTIAGLRELERAGLRSALMEAVFKAAERSRELG